MKIFQSLIISWLEARLITHGTVTTNQAVAVFGIKRQNMAAHVKEWKMCSGLPAYDSSRKAFIRTAGSISLIFPRESDAATYLQSLDTALSFIPQVST